MTPIERFMAKVEWGEKFNGTRCLLWRNTKGGGGYGHFRVGGRLHRAHRWLYERWVSPIPDGMDLDHLCRNRACVNPMHLEPVTRAENLRRGEPYRDRAAESNANAAKTHCPQGHPYDEENTAYYKGYRRCRACAKNAARTRRSNA